MDIQEKNIQSEIIRKNIFSNSEAAIRIKIKNAILKTDEQRIKRLSKKPLSIEQKIIQLNYNASSTGL